MFTGSGFEDLPEPSFQTVPPPPPTYSSEPLPTISGTYSATSVFCADVLYETPLYASVIRANPTATEYAIECGLYPDGSHGMCAVYNSSMHVLTVGPSTMVATAMDTYVYVGSLYRLDTMSTDQFIELAALTASCTAPPLRTANSPCTPKHPTLAAHSPCRFPIRMRPIPDIMRFRIL